MQEFKVGPGIYVHIPFCIKKCHYCDFNSRVAPSSERDLYVVALEREIGLRAKDWAGVVFQTVYIGGGTPTTYPPGTLGEILQELRQHFDIAPGAEVTVEANPDTVTAADLERLLDAGFNRLSLGFQSLRDEDLRFLGRIHTADAAVRAYLAARTVGWQNINVDLIRGLPAHTRDNWREVLMRVVDLAPDHISCYGLTLEPETRLYRRHLAGEFEMPSDERLAELFDVTAEVLQDAGFEHYEISNWARAGRQCRHNVNYWLDGEYVGLGAGAWSHRDGARYGNVCDTRDYIRRVSAAASPVEQIDRPQPWAKVVERVTLGLRLVGGVRWDHLTGGLDESARVRLRGALEELARDGLVCFNDGLVSATRRGLLLLNEIGVRLL